MRLNIYVPDGLASEVSHYRSWINLSQVCSAAIRDAIEAIQTHRSFEELLRRMHPTRTRLEETVEWRYGVRRAIAAETNPGDDARTTVARSLASLLNRVLTDEMHVALAGGVQMWMTVQALTPRSSAATLYALGAGHVDLESPHLHANALVTLLSLLYAPRARAMLVTSPAFRETFGDSWRPVVKPGTEVRRVIVGSCAPFHSDWPYARVLGQDLVDYLIEERVVGEFLGVFFAEDGRLLEPYVPGYPVSHIAAVDLRELSKREDTLVILAAGGTEKAWMMERVLAEGLVNTVVTEEGSVKALLALPSTRR